MSWLAQTTCSTVPEVRWVTLSHSPVMQSSCVIVILHWKEKPSLSRPTAMGALFVSRPPAKQHPQSGGEASKASLPLKG
jgi:hypothetical protein